MELAQEVRAQYDALPIKVSFFEGDGQPYQVKGAVSSTAMHKNINDNNHLAIFKTEAGSFGPEGVAMNEHPLLEDSGRTTTPVWENGEKVSDGKAC